MRAAVAPQDRRQLIAALDHILTRFWPGFGQMYTLHTLDLRRIAAAGDPTGLDDLHLIYT
jgi:hypothetical protein